MTCDEIKNELHRLFANERENDVNILRMINEAEATRSWAVFGYPNLFKWLVSEFKLSNGFAGRRIQAAQMMRSVPEVEDKLEQGSLNLSTLCQTQAKINAQEKATGAKVSAEEKATAIHTVENKTCEQAEESLLNMFPEAAPEPTAPKPRKMKNKKTRLPLDLSDEQLTELKRPKEVLSHIFPKGDTVDVISYAIKDVLKRKDPLRGPSTPASVSRRGKTHKPKSKQNLFELTLNAENSMSGNETGNSSSTHVRLNHNSKQSTEHTQAQMSLGQLEPTLKARMYREVFRSSGGSCVFVGEDGHVCREKALIQKDRKHPRARGGLDTFDNLRPLCRTHNLYEAERIFGKKHMDQFRRGRQ